jgi:ribA/ribD-fused uncharacterized protein
MIGEFQGDYRWLSNFWPVNIVLDGITYPTVEHAYQAAKTDIPALRAEIAVCGKPGTAKRLGRRLTLRQGWEDEKLEVMEDLLRQKFAPGTQLARWLLGTGYQALIEGNAWGDRFWGVSCPGPRSLGYSLGLGMNHLGTLLMHIREDLRR